MIFDTIELFLTELCPLDLENFQLFALSVHFFISEISREGGMRVSQTSFVYIFIETTILQTVMLFITLEVT